MAATHPSIEPATDSAPATESASQRVSTASFSNRAASSGCPGTQLPARLAEGALAGLGVAVGAHVALRVGLRRNPRPMPHQMARWLEHPARLRYRDPGALLGLYGLYHGMTVADLGCGTGLFTLEMARMVGQEGTVHAVDIQAPLLERVRARAEAAGLDGPIRLHHAGLHTLPLADASVDLAVMIAVASEVPALELALQEVQRVLKPGGRVVLSEELPDPAYVPSWWLRRRAQWAGLRYGGNTGSPFCYSLLFFNDGDGSDGDGIDSNVNERETTRPGVAP